jgi:hypothetical protein
MTREYILSRIRPDIYQHIKIGFDMYVRETKSVSKLTEICIDGNYYELLIKVAHYKDDKGLYKDGKIYIIYNDSEIIIYDKTSIQLDRDDKIKEILK